MSEPVLGVDRSSMFQQHLHSLVVTLAARKVERCPQVIVRQAEVPTLQVRNNICKDFTNENSNWMVDIYSELSQIRKHCFEKNMIDKCVWQIKWVSVSICILY